MADLKIVHSPELWPQYPYLRLERRTDTRPGQATCFVQVTPKQDVEPTVFATHNWPPPDTEEVPVVLRLEYPDWDALFAEGWRVILPTWLRLS